MLTAGAEFREARRRRLAMVVALFALAPAVATQVSGTINAKAPRVSTVIHFAEDSKLELHYTSIRYGKGRWRMLPGRRSKKAQADFNAMAQAKPIGRVVTSYNVVACGNMIPPGSYDLYFTLNGDHGWEINLRKQGDESAFPISWHMHPKSTRALHKRLVFTLDPGAAPDTAVWGFAFGQYVLAIPLELRDARYPYGRPADAEDGKPVRGATPPAGRPPSASKKSPRSQGATKSEPLRRARQSESARVRSQASVPKTGAGKKAVRG